MGSACGFCVKAESLLKSQLASGQVVKKSASEAGGKFNGFPAFESIETGKTHTGLPQSYEQLAKKLGHAEHYSRAQVKGHHNDSKKGPSVLEIIIIVVAVLTLLGLVGFLAYRSKK